jgi:cytochrome b
MAATKVFLVIDYIACWLIFGTFYWIYDGILVDLNLLTVGSDLHVWTGYLWAGSLVFFMIFGTFYFYRGLKEYDIKWR